MSGDVKNQQDFKDQVNDMPEDITRNEIDEILGEKGGFSESDIVLDIDESEFEDGVDFMPDLTSDIPDMENDVEETGKK